MAVLAPILPFVSRCSALALLLYHLAAAEQVVAKDLLRTARAISSLALIAKEVGTIIKEDDRLPSAEAFESVEDILEQCTAILDEVNSIVSQQKDQRQRQGDRPQHGGHNLRLSQQAVARLHYFAAHVDALRATLSAMVQTLYTAQSIMWARLRPTVSPKQCATAVANEKQQLETLIIDQQMAILRASKLYAPASADARLLMEKDSSQSLVVRNRSTPKPASLSKYQDKFIESLGIHVSDEEHWLATVCGISKSQLDRLLERWTTLRQFEDGLLDAERKVQAQKRESQQPFVESESEDDGAGSLLESSRDGADKARQADLDLPGLSVPTLSSCSSPVSPRSSISSLPGEAAAAVKAKDQDDDSDLGIPWTLRTHRQYWKYIDGKVQDSNTTAPTSDAFLYRSSWTEVQASWVCKEAIKEAGYPFKQVQKEISDGRRTKFETCFCIERALTFDQIHQLVERTVELYRQAQPSSPRLREGTRRTSFDQRPLAKGLPDRDRTPVAAANKPLLERSSTGFYVPPLVPLDRTMSLPDQGFSYPSHPRPPYLQMPTAANPIMRQVPPLPFSAKPAPSYPSQSSLYQPQSPQGPPLAGFSTSAPIATRQYMQPGNAPQQPLRSSFDNKYYEPYSSPSGNSDSETAVRSRSRRRSRSRGYADKEKKKKGRGHGKAKALIGVAGLTALLDGLVGI